MKNLNKKVVFSIAIAILLISVSLIFKQSSIYQENFGPNKTLSETEITEKLTNFINNDLLMGQATASILEISKKNNFYLTKIDIDGTQFDSYVTLDGKIFFPEGYILN